MLKDNLKKLREARKLTKKDVANSTGITERAYIAYEYGERDVSTETLIKLADFYGVSTDYLLGRTDEKPDPVEMLNADEMEKKLLKAYFQLKPQLRAEFLQGLAETMAIQEGIIQTVKPQNSEKAVARSSNGNFLDVPDEETRATFTKIEPSPDF